MKREHHLCPSEASLADEAVDCSQPPHCSCPHCSSPVSGKLHGQDSTQTSSSETYHDSPSGKLHGQDSTQTSSSEACHDSPSGKLHGQDTTQTSSSETCDDSLSGKLHGQESTQTSSSETRRDSLASAGSSSCCQRGGGGGRMVWTCAARAGFVALILMSCLGVNLARPTAYESEREKRSQDEQADKTERDKALEYLLEFGYLSSSSGNGDSAGSLMSPADITRAIKNLQAMGSIPQTGVIDRRTEELIQKPRCGVKDTGVISGQGRSDLDQNGEQGSDRYKRYVVTAFKWHKKKLTFSILNFMPDIHSPWAIRDEITRAFNMWSDGTHFQFTEVRYGNADILIKFVSRDHGDGLPFDGPASPNGRGKVLAHAFFPGPGRGGDTHFDEDEFWTINSPQGIDLFSVAAHEFGHALGLNHTNDNRTLMYPWYRRIPKNFSLPRDEREGIRKLYGLPGDDDNGSGDDFDKSDDDDYDDYEDYTPPNLCTTPFDAINIIGSEVFIFIGKWLWRMERDGGVTEPMLIYDFWLDLPEDVTKVDAVLEREGDKHVVIFSGDRHWVFNGSFLIPGFPKKGLPITELGIPPHVKRIDAAYTWGLKGQRRQWTYVVSGDRYWMVGRNNKVVKKGYPKDMFFWRGVPVPLDAAFQYWDGITYFFRGLQYWKFYSWRMRTYDGYPRSIAQDWLPCSAGALMTTNISASLSKEDQPGSSAMKNCPPSWILAVVVFLLCSVDWKRLDE